MPFVVDDQLRIIAAEQPYPLLFATLSGAHLYGFPSPDSDYDLRGCHILPLREVIGLDSGRETVEVSTKEGGFELDLVTHDTRKFFGLLLKKNGYVLEQVYSPLIVHTTPEHEELKFRLRYYNSDPSLVSFEKKSKTGGLCSKRKTCIGKNEVLRILDGDYAFLIEGDALQQELYAKLTTQQLRPRVIVDYLREPYVYAPGNVRVTIDSDIRTGLYSRSFFDAALPTVRAGDTPYLLEVKFDEFLPDVIFDALQIGSRRASAFSKYAASRMFG
jgi:hypothetical protein